MDSFWHMLLETTKNLYSQESNEIQSQSPTWSTPRNLNKTSRGRGGGGGGGGLNSFFTSPTVDEAALALAPPRWQSSPQHDYHLVKSPSLIAPQAHNNNSNNNSSTAATSSAATDSGAVLSSQQESSGFDELDSANAIAVVSSSNRPSFDPLQDLLSICLASVNLSATSAILSPPPPPPPPAASSASPAASFVPPTPTAASSAAAASVGVSHLPTLPEETTTTSELEVNWLEMMQQQQQQRKCDRRRFKTELCRKFSLTGDCEYADKCQYAHGWIELRASSRHPRYKTQLCVTFHTSGLCPYGQRCDFIHNESENCLREIRLQIQLYNQYKRFFPNEREIPMEKIQALVKTLTLSEAAEATRTTNTRPQRH